MLKRLLSAAVALTVLFSLMLTTGCKESAKEKLKVGFVYIGPVNDGGWTQAHDNGRKQLEEELDVETKYLENVPDDKPAEAIEAIENLIDLGCKVIFTTSFGYMDPTVEMAEKYKDVKFFHCSGYKRAETGNMSTYFGKIEEPRYLSGIVAGLKTKSNKIGYVAAMPIPEVIRGINAFTLGVQSVNKDAKVIVRWSNTWIDETKEKEAAITLLDEGCDVLTQHNDSTAPQLAAQDRNAFAIGYDLDSRDAAPKAYMTAPIFNWGPYYVEQVKAIIDGKWEASDFWEGMKEGIVDLAELTNNAPSQSVERVNTLKKDIMDGKFSIFNIFKGPLKDQTGAVKIQDGKTMTGEEILNMDWFIYGVEGTIPKS